MALATEYSYVSCGIRQLYGLESGSKENPFPIWNKELFALAHRLYRNSTGDRLGCICEYCVERRESKNEGVARGCAFVIFSDADNFENGKKFAEFLESKGWEVLELISGKNPNTGNTIRLWSWVLPEFSEFKKALTEEV